MVNVSPHCVPGVAAGDPVQRIVGEILSAGGIDAVGDRKYIPIVVGSESEVVALVHDRSGGGRAGRLPQLRQGCIRNRSVGEVQLQRLKTRIVRHCT
jgi:hypothetical protein